MYFRLYHLDKSVNSFSRQYVTFSAIPVRLGRVGGERTEIRYVVQAAASGSLTALPLAIPVVVRPPTPMSQNDCV